MRRALAGEIQPAPRQTDLEAEGWAALLQTLQSVRDALCPLH